jgi:hypothetical protein
VLPKYENTMDSIIVILIIIAIFVSGLIILYHRHSWIVKRLIEVHVFREKFIEFSNIYFSSYDKYSRSGEVNNTLYVWLTMNVNKIQEDMGYFGVVDYIAPFRTHKVSNYRVLLNTLPKYRDGEVRDQDVNLVDDCLLRYIGFAKEKETMASKNLKNPLVWFREGIKYLLSIPIFILNMFGIFSARTVERITDNVLFKIISGIIALVTLASGLVTIIIGYDQSFAFVQSLISNQK